MFSSAANRDCLHPLDREKWLEFLIATHKRDRDVPTDILQRWFLEEEEWHFDSAHRLVLQYEFARELLRKYDAQI